MKKSFVGFWGETIKNVRLDEHEESIKVYGTAECPKDLLEAKTDSLEFINLNKMISVPVCFEVSKSTNKKEGFYRLYTPEETDGFKIPPEYEERYSPLVFECNYHEDKLKGTPVFCDQEGKRHPIVLDRKSFFPSFVKKLNQNKRG